jgi:hypothetical protein
METTRKVLVTALFSILVSSAVFSQNELMFGSKKIKIPGNEICNYTINKNSHLAKDYLDISNGVLLYTQVEYEQGKPVHIEITECRMEYIDKKNCSLGASDQKSTYTPGQIYVLYLYTLKDEVNISTTIYESPEKMSIIENNSVGRLHFRDLAKAELCYNTYFR